MVQMKSQHSLALTAALNYVKNNAPQLVYSEISKALAEQLAPLQRTWVGLTDEEITDIWAESIPCYYEDDFARAIEAKLKEKNT